MAFPSPAPPAVSCCFTKHNPKELGGSHRLLPAFPPVAVSRTGSPPERWVLSLSGFHQPCQRAELAPSTGVCGGATVPASKSLAAGFARSSEQREGAQGLALTLCCCHEKESGFVLGLDHCFVSFCFLFFLLLFKNGSSGATQEEDFGSLWFSFFAAAGRAK